jgi:hypothetical protein
MSVTFTAASSQYLHNASPVIVTYPVTFTLWANPLSSGASVQSVLEYGNNSVGTSWMGLEKTTAWWLVSSVASTPVSATATLSVGRWDFLIARMISATNRRLTRVTSQGEVAHDQNTTSSNPTLDRLTLGAWNGGGGFSSYSDLQVAELCIWDADIQPDGAQMENWFARKLAFEGPFAFPGLIRNLIEYRSFKSSILTDEPNQAYFGRRGRIAWTQSASAPQIGVGSPLMGSYKRPPRGLIIPPTPI